MDQLLSEQLLTGIATILSQTRATNGQLLQVYHII